MKVIVRTCGEYVRTLKKWSEDKAIGQALKDFILAKKADPLAAASSKDYPYKAGTPLNGYWHAGLNFDISVVYTLHGSGDIRYLDLYGIYNHDEIGAGTPANPKRAKQTAKVWGNQQFNDVPEEKRQVVDAKKQAEIERVKKLQQRAMQQ